MRRVTARWHRSCIAAAWIGLEGRRCNSNGGGSEGGVDDLMAALKEMSQRTGTATKQAKTPATKSATFPCGVCGKVFPSLSARNAHVQLRHGGAVVADVAKTGAPEDTLHSASSSPLPTASAATTPLPIGSVEPGPTATAIPAVQESLVSRLQRVVNIYKASLEAVNVAIELTQAQQKLREIAARKHADGDGGSLLLPMVADKRPFGGSAPALPDQPRLRDRKRKQSAAQAVDASTENGAAAPQLFVGGASSVRVFGVVERPPKVGTIEVPTKDGTVDEPCVELVLRTYGYRPARMAGVTMMLNNFIVRLHGKRCLKGIEPGDLLDCTGVIALHAAYNLDDNVWRDDTVIHVHGASGSVRYLGKVDVPTPIGDAAPVSP
jgi:cell division protein ZapA (FtsZ GTPase activity inhibitor)